MASVSLRLDMEPCNRNVRLGHVRVVKKQISLPNTHKTRPKSSPNCKLPRLKSASRPSLCKDVELLSDPGKSVPVLKKYVRTKNSNRIVMTCVPGKQKPGSPTIRPVVPIKPRSNPMSTDVGFGQLFSSTTIVNGATQSELTTIHTQIHEGKNTLDANLKTKITTGIQDQNLPKIDQQTFDSTTLETLEVPVETLVSENNEIQTIRIGDFSNLIPFDNQGSNNEETFIASTDSDGNCYVTVQKQNSVVTPQTNCIPKASKLISTVKSSSAGLSCFGSKRGIIRFGRSRMIADTHTSIPVQEFKAQLNDTSDIIGKMDIAPTTKRLMHVLNTKGVNKLFGNPGRPMGRIMLQQFVRHLTMKQNLRQDTFEDMQLQPIGFIPTVDPSTIKRITRKRRYPEAEEYQRKLLSEQLQQSFEHLVAESDSMQTIFLPNEEILPDYRDEDLILVEDSSISLIEHQTDDEVSVLGLYTSTGDDEDLQSGQDPQITLSDDKPTIIMVHEGDKLQQGTTYTPKNIEILLAAAEKRGISRDNIQRVIFCQPPKDTLLPEGSHIVLLPRNPSEELAGSID